MLMNKKTQSCCSGPGCCGPLASDEKEASKAAITSEKPNKAAGDKGRTLMIDFLYLDLEVCTRCQGTDDTLDQAIAEVEHVLKAAGISVQVNKVNVNTEELAIQYEFLSSPTIRIDGQDIALDVQESQCESCGDLCGDSVDCRVWTWQGEDYTQPPKAMIVNAILAAVYAPQKPVEQKMKSYEVPENLKHFYKAMKDKSNS